MGVPHCPAWASKCLPGLMHVISFGTSCLFHWDKKSLPIPHLKISGEPSGTFIVSVQASV